MNRNFLCSHLIFLLSVCLTPLWAQIPKINEFNVDQETVNSLEFVEIYLGVPVAVPIPADTFLFWSDEDGTILDSIDLNGKEVDDSGLFLAGTPDVPGVHPLGTDPRSALLPAGFSDRGSILVFRGEVPTLVTTVLDLPSSGIIDAVVYTLDGTIPTALSGLAVYLLASGQNAIDLNEFSQGTLQAAQRFPHGSGGQKETETFLMGVPSPKAKNLSRILINEVDSDTPLETPLNEFIEIYDGGLGNTVLDGLVVVLFDGITDLSYRTFDLTGRLTDGNGFFLIGNADVPGVDWEIPSNSLQIGTDAVALYVGIGSDFPVGTSISEAYLIDALVYGVEGAGDLELMDLLEAGQPQIHEDGRGNKFHHSMQRFPDMQGGNRTTEAFTIARPTPKMSNRAAIIINEIDVDQEGADTREFIELYDQGAGSTSLDGLVLALFDGDSDEIYASFSLEGESTDANGYYLIGNSGVANVDMVINNGTLQQEPDANAIAVFMGNLADYPVGTSVTTSHLEEAVVYDIGSIDDGGLLQLLNPGQPQVNENGLGNRFMHSLQRFPNGAGGTRNTNMFAPAIPTPKRANIQRTNRIVINEVDAFGSNSDNREFIELFDGGQGGTPLDGILLVLFNGLTNTSYYAVDLTGFVTDQSGYFLLGNSLVLPTPNILFSNGLLQNGADAVVIYNSSIDLFPNGTGLSLFNIEDAIVYDTNDPDDPELLQLLNVGQIQVNESGRGNSAAHSLQRYPNGSGGPRNTNTYISVLPTPNADNFSGLLINELDSDTEGTDKLEFIELFDGGRGNSQLDGLVMVFFSGVSDTSYAALDLDGNTTDSEGYFLIGNISTNPDLVIADGLILNSNSAVAIYNDDAASFPNGTAIRTTGLSDAIVYGPTVDTGLLPLLNAGQAQLDEDGRGNKDGHSLQRSPNGRGGIRNTQSYIQTVPTPRFFNIEMSYDLTRLTRLDDPGNPGGLNLEEDGYTTGWTDLNLPSQSINSWSNPVSLPFSFRFFGIAVSGFKVSHNGLLTFNTGSSLLPSDNQDNQALLNNNSINAAIPELLPELTICSFWDQFTSVPPTGANDQVKMKVFGSSPNRQLWVKWFSFEYGDPSSSFNYFSVVLEESTHLVYLVDDNYHSGTAVTSSVGVYRDSELAVQYDPPPGSPFGPDEIPFHSGESIPEDNDYYAFLPISNRADIEVDSHMMSVFGVGDRATYVVDVTNQGPNGATDILIHVTLSDKLDYQSHDSMGRPFDIFSGAWNVGYLPFGETATLTIEADCLESGIIVNIAELMAMDGFDVDSVPSNGEVLEDDYHRLEVDVSLAADVSLLVTLDNVTPSRADPVVFSLTLTNMGPDDAHNLSVVGVLPRVIRFDSSSGSGTYSNTTGIWELGVLPSETSSTLNLYGTVLQTSGAEGSGLFEAQLLASDELDPDSTPGNDVLLEDDQDSVTFFARLEYVMVAPTTTEFIVNSHTADIQAFPSVFCDPSGDFMVAWQSEGGLDGDLSGIFGKGYDHFAVPLTTEFRMNYTTVGDQKYPQISGDGLGNRVVSWESMNQDGHQQGVFSMGYDSFGVSMIPEFQVNTFTVGAQKNAALVCNRNDGRFVVVWESTSQDGTESSIFAQCYLSSGQPEGDEFPVNSSITGCQRNPRIAMGEDGNFVVVWESEVGTSISVWGRRFAADGTPQGQEFKVACCPDENQENPDISMAPSGEFAIVWQAPRPDGGFGIYGQKFSNDGGAVGDEFQVNSYVSGHKSFPRVFMDDLGHFVVVWHSLDQNGPEADIYGQQYKNTGLAEGVEFRVNETTVWDQAFPSISGDPSGNFVVVWQSFSQDGDDEGIVGRLFRAPCEALRQLDQWPGLTILDLIECL